MHYTFCKIVSEYLDISVIMLMQLSLRTSSICQSVCLSACVHVSVHLSIFLFLSPWAIVLVKFPVNHISNVACQKKPMRTYHIHSILFPMFGLLTLILLGVSVKVSEQSLCIPALFVKTNEIDYLQKSFWKNNSLLDINWTFYCNYQYFVMLLTFLHILY